MDTGPLSRECAECGSKIGEFCVIMTEDGKRTDKVRAPHAVRMRAVMTEKNKRDLLAAKRGGAKHRARVRRQMKVETCNE